MFQPTKQIDALLRLIRTNSATFPAMFSHNRLLNRGGLDRN
ncbi:hypothetical protein Z948_283 [Sulfitobacter donghicola DSW-25 = KCTC 12864 = JCM 14565]|nr:hypothetical protein Z948_283 [Sulfitobacter donghicola DSW-25 = KCTC 12864 = JCM 14565]